MPLGSLKRHVRDLPVIGPPLRQGWSRFDRWRFRSSQDYWDQRYRHGGTSGSGSSGHLARFKAGVLDAFVAEHDIAPVVEWGGGDGEQLALAHYPSYVGVDVSPTAIAACRARFADDPTKAFTTVASTVPQCELALSLDVTYHLVEDEVFASYIRDVFASATRFVILYTSDTGRFEPAHEPVPHIRHRPVGAHVAAHFPEWSLRERIANAHPYDGDPETSSFADFSVYERASS